MSCENNCLCPGCFNVWFLEDQPDVWTEVQDVLSWDVQPDITTSSKRRTSTSLGLKRKRCPDAIGYDGKFTVELCPAGPLAAAPGSIQQFCDFLQTPSIPSSGVCTWWFFGWDCANASNTAAPAIPPAGPAGGLSPLDAAYNINQIYTDGGWLFYAQVIPGGITGDNDADEVATMEFSLSIFNGPYLPSNCP